MPSDHRSDAPYTAGKPKPWWRWLRLLPFIVAIGIFGYRPYMNLTGEKRVRKVCAALTPGMSMDSVATFAEKHGMYPPGKYSKGDYIGDKATANWYNCDLEIKDGVLQRATYFDFGRRNWLY